MTYFNIRFDRVLQALKISHGSSNRLTIHGSARAWSQLTTTDLRRGGRNTAFEQILHRSAIRHVNLLVLVMCVREKAVQSILWRRMDDWFTA